MTALIATMLVVSAVCEAFGTVAVWINYRSGADVAAKLLAEVEDEDDQDRYVKEQYGINPALLIGNEVPYHELVAARARIRTVRRDIGRQLRRRWYLTAGLVAYIAGALVALAAGLVALFR